MVTRFQAKRKAEEELVGSPSKSAKSSDSNAISNKQTSQGANAALSFSSNRSKGDRSDRNSLFSNTGKATPDENAENAVVQPRKEQSTGKAAAAAGSEHTADDTTERPKERSESQQKHEEDEHPKALEFAQKLQLIVEKRRAVGTGSITTAQASLQMERIAHLCELASKKEIQRNMFLTIFTTQWWDDLQNLQGPIKELQNAAKDVEHYEQTFDKASEAFETTVVERGAALLGDSPNGQEASEDDKHALHESVSNARREFAIARNTWDIVREQQIEKQANFDHVLTGVLNEGEQSLVNAEYLRHWYFGQSQDSAPARPDRPGRIQSDNAEDRQNERAAQQDSPGQERNNEPLIVEDIVAGLRNDQCHELERTRLAYNTAVEKFAAVRSKYYRKLADFLSKQNQGSVYGTRTDFDNRYFIERNRANREVAMARDMYEFALEEADKTGALSVGQRVWAFNDEADSGRGSGNGRIIQVLRDMINERIESWRQNEDQKEITSERHWPTMPPNLSDENGASLAGLSQWSEDHGRATGKRRRLIDD